MVRVTGVEPARREAQDPKSCVSANSTIPAYERTKNYLLILAEKNQTCNTLI